MAISSARRGLARVRPDPAAVAADLEGEWEVLAEAVQTVMRRYGVPQAYEKLKALSRGQAVTRESLIALVESLALPEDARARLLALTPATYSGYAEELARTITGL